MRELVVVEDEDLEDPTTEIRLRHVEDEFFLKLGTDRLAVDAALKLTSSIGQQTDATERIGSAAELSRNEISRLINK